ncbi:hypothetical protein BJY17_001640 [Agromyces hippuratus]|uniref:DUF4190 domain-containing protein n=1 Tax=Agromyces hippuratus TaxID=286438 RepID=A0A852WY96_9MICO|nr:DUF4190 domain-containing protein [Agromyces hippuratus]NYG20893.1 hypothetical protein [Agromyces hippuratus]
MTDPNLPEQPAVPPVPPAPPAATEVPAAPAAPAAPAYAAPQQPAAPAYAQPAPAYGQPAPAYGQPAYGQAPAAKTNVLAIVSLVSAFFVSLAAIITGHIALSQIKKTGEQGRGLAIAGLIIGYVGLAAGLIWIILVIVLAAAGAFSSSYSY